MPSRKEGDTVRCADFPLPQDHLPVCHKDGKTCQIYRNDGTRHGIPGRYGFSSTYYGL